MTQPELWDVNGRFLGRLDFYWPQFGVVGEADGLAKYESSAVLREEKHRQERLEVAGLIVVRWGWADLTTFDQVVTRLKRAFDRGAARAQPRGWIQAAH